MKLPKTDQEKRVFEENPLKWWNENLPRDHPTFRIVQQMRDLRGWNNEQTMATLLVLTFAELDWHKEKTMDTMVVAVAGRMEDFLEGKIDPSIRAALVETNCGDQECPVHGMLNEPKEGEDKQWKH